MIKLLSVDDNTDNLFLLETMAEGHGYYVVSCDSGHKALTRLEEEHFDLIISDILMPEMDGFQLCHEVKSRPHLREIPFIFFTAAYTSKQDEQFGLSLGALRFVVKPSNPEDFMQAISRIVNEKPSVDEKLAGPVGQPALNDETSYLRNHNERLIEKLGEEIVELQKARLDLETQLAEREKEISRRKKAEQDLAESAERLTQANHNLLQFAYAAAHDLREPVRNVAHVLGLLQVAHGESLSDEASSLVEEGICGLRRMHSMVTDLLTLAKIDDVNPGDCPAVDTASVLQEVLQDMVALRDSHSQLSFRPLPAVKLKRAHLVQLFQNLISNALKYSRTGVSPVIEVSAVCQATQACITVEDNGIGFEQAYSEQIFGIFRRLHPSHEFEGTGIGLAICARIVALYGGRIWAESVPDKGSKFHFTLPLAD